MRIKSILVLLVMVMLGSLSPTASALQPGDPVPPLEWKMNLSKTKYIGNGCWREWKYVKCTPYGNYGKNRYNATYNIRSLRG
jgi:hypothetical protein